MLINPVAGQLNKSSICKLNDLIKINFYRSEEIKELIQEKFAGFRRSTDYNTPSYRLATSTGWSRSKTAGIGSTPL